MPPPTVYMAMLVKVAKKSITISLLLQSPSLATHLSLSIHDHCAGEHTSSSVRQVRPTGDRASGHGGEGGARVFSASFTVPHPH